MIITVGLFLMNYLLVSLVRGVNRYNAISKYQPDYYLEKPIGFIEKVVHNCIKSAFSLVTVGVSFIITLIEYFLLDRFTFLI